MRYVKYFYKQFSHLNISQISNHFQFQVAFPCLFTSYFLQLSLDINYSTKFLVPVNELSLVA